MWVIYPSDADRHCANHVLEEADTPTTDDFCTRSAKGHCLQTGRLRGKMTTCLRACLRDELKYEDH